MDPLGQVETKGRTLKELDEIFEAKNPRKASTTRAKIQQRTKKIKQTNMRKWLLSNVIKAIGSASLLFQPLRELDQQQGSVLVVL
jgi:hypothetical protein